MARAPDQGADDLAGGFQPAHGIGRQADAECDKVDIRAQQHLQLSFEIRRRPQHGIVERLRRRPGNLIFLGQPVDERDMVPGQTGANGLQGFGFRHAFRHHDIDADRQRTDLPANRVNSRLNRFRRIVRNTVDTHSTGLGEGRGNIDAMGETEDRHIDAEAFGKSGFNLGHTFRSLRKCLK